jgi:hypothetical protein
MGEQSAMEWLLGSDEPGVRFLARRDILGEPADDDAAELVAGPMVCALLADQLPDGGFGVDPYRKWTGAHWRLVALAELAVPLTDPRVQAAADHVLDWLTHDGPIAAVPLQWSWHGTPGSTTSDGLPLVHAAVHGNALGACCRLGLGDDPRARALAEALIRWQWPDGGWNCDQKASGRRSSFDESLPTAWGLWEYARATGDASAQRAAARSAELFLEHRLLYSRGTGRPSGRRRRPPAGRVINPRWLELRYPSYWHYDMLQVLLVLARMDKLIDPRAADALDELERRRLPDGRWAADGRWWNPPDSRITPDVVDWGQPGQPNQMITLNALRVLRAAQRPR